MRPLLAATLLVLMALPWPSSGNASPTFVRKWATEGQPLDLAMHSTGEVFVSGRGNVQRFGSDGALQVTWPGGPAYRPSLDVGPDGRVYVTDTGGSRVEVYEQDGSFVLAFGEFCGLGCDNGLVFPQAISVDADGFVYVFNAYGDGSGRDAVHKYSPSGVHLAAFGAGQFNAAEGIATEGTSFVYIADTLDHQIEKWTTSGLFVMAWGSGGRGPGQFDRPTDVAYDPRGFLYVADGNNFRIQQFTTNGAFVDEWGSRGTADGQFDTPHGVEVGPDGLIYVVDHYNARVQVFGDQPVTAQSATWGRLKSWYRN